MRHVFKGLLAAVALTALAGAPAKADVIVPLVNGGGWTEFFFGAPGNFPDFQDASGDTEDFTFTLTDPGILRITDGFNDGDQFEVTVNGVTSLASPGIFTGNNILDCWDCVFVYPDISATYSHATYYLGPGSYTVTGDVTVSPFGSGAGAIMLGGPVPEPTTWALMLAGFGGLGAVLRRSRRRALAAMPA
jgi:PEP-CTERM motif-containing protein